RDTLRRLAATLVAALLAVPAGDLGSAPSAGTISGTVKLGGRPLAGVTVAFIDIQSGAVVRTVSKSDGTFEVQAPNGEYAVTTESQAGLAVEKAPVRVAVAEGKNATADVELVSVPSGVPLEAPAGAATAGAAGAAAAAPPAAAAAAAAAATQEAAPPAATPNVTPEGFIETTGKGAQIQFKPVTCFVAGEYPLLDAAIEPQANVARARIYFKPAKVESYFYVEMGPDQGRFFGKLPRPRVEASPITYYLQSTTTEFEESQTKEIEAAVVQNKDDCRGKAIAAFGPAGPVTVFSAASGSLAAPVGFAAAASGIAVGLVALIASGAAAAGIVGGVVVGPGPGGPTPPASVATPSPIPVPTPAPVPTPIPITTFR
ncbi:MAG TPA: carboxypeptidase-like regulatory domain-containing protein, partial [Vicinamibacteria bacterium]|nr:carboxypeptidase-like regulatory domain-containing protein [Vicinamibacteria bacterium]